MRLPIAFGHTGRSLQPRPAEDASEYVSQVKRLFLERRCVQSVFTAADDQLATELYRKGIPLEKVERAILLGCLRKYVNWCDRGGGTPITTLHHFTRLFDEVERVNVSDEYWTYVGQKVRTLAQRIAGRDRIARTETK